MKMIRVGICTKKYIFPKTVEYDVVQGRTTTLTCCLYQILCILGFESCSLHLMIVQTFHEKSDFS